MEAELRAVELHGRRKVGDAKGRMALLDIGSREG
jgi:hypothetical protein